MNSKDELEKGLKKLFQDIKLKGGKAAVYNMLNHAVKSPKVIDFINEENKKEGKEPVAHDGYLNTVTRRVLQNCIKLSHSILLLEGTSNRRNVPKEVILNMKLLVYLQVIETRYIYKIFGNCLKILLDEQPDSELFDNIDNKPYKQVNELYDRLKADGKSYSCIDSWLRLFDNELRNIIGHNDYYIEKDTLITSTGMTDAIKRKDEPRRLIYSSDEITDLFNNARLFNESFNNSILVLLKELKIPCY